MKPWISRSAAWLFTTSEENLYEVVATLDDKTEDVTNADTGLRFKRH